MPKSNTYAEGEQSGTNSSARSNIPQDSKLNRAEQLEEKIKEIWKEVHQDVETLSEPPNDDRKTWRKNHVFSGWGHRKEKGMQLNQDEDASKQVEDPTKKILSMMEEATPELATNKGKTHERLRNTVTSTIQCINTLGKVIAGGAAQAFAPAPSIFEALSFFLQFWLKYINMLDTLEQLLTKCNDFVGRLHIYEFLKPTDDIIELKHIAAQLLGKLVKVLLFSVNIQKKRWVVGEIAKQSFLNDSKLDQLMSEMESLVETEHITLAALTMKGVSNIRQVMAQQQVAADAKAWRAAISHALGFGDEEPKRLWGNRLEEIRHSLMDETGKWLTESEDFLRWTSESDHSLPFLVIEGPKNTGKSYLMANIINYLERERSNHAVVYYFRDSNADRYRTQTRTQSLVSKCLLWQCATSLGVLMKSMAEKCQWIGFNPNANDMWGQLFLHNTVIEKINELPFYILVDGVKDDEKDLIEMLLTLVQKRPSTFHILVTTQSSSVCRALSGISSYRLILSSAEQQEWNSDIDLFIREHMRNMPAFDGSTHPKAAEYRAKIEKKVREKSEGDFAWMANALQRLRSKHHLADIDLILSDMDKRRTKQISEEIESLNRSLTVEEIKEINEIILWVMTSCITPTLDFMDAVLSCSSNIESIMPLRHRLAPLLRANESGRIEFRLPECEDQIPRTQKPKIAEESQSSLMSRGSSQTADVEVETVHRFLRYISPRREDYDKKALESVLWGNSLDGMKATISYDEQNAHLKMALTCIRVFTNQSNEHTDRLLLYAGNHLLHHLQNAKLHEADKTLKIELGNLLVKLFREGQAIDKMFWISGKATSHLTWQETEAVWLTGNRDRWLYTSEGVDEVVKWFSDPITRTDVPKSSEPWVSQLVGKKQGHRRHEILLRCVAERLAYRLFLDEKTYTTREQLTAVYFLHGYIIRTSEGKEGQSLLKDRSRLSWEEFRSIRDWAVQLPELQKGMQEKEWLGKIQTARAIFTSCEGDEEATRAAKELLKEVQQLDAKLWKGNILACQSIAAELQSERSYTRAKELLLNATKDLVKTDQSLTQSDKLRAAIALLDLGDLYWEKDEKGDSQPKRAMEAYQRSLEFDLTRYARYAEVLIRYKKAGLYSDMLTFVRATCQELDKMYLNRLVYDYLGKDEFQRCILSATEEEDWETTIHDVYSEAIKIAENSHAELFHLRKAYGAIMHQGGGLSAEQCVVDHWEAALTDGKLLATTTGEMGWTELFEVIDPLANIYLRRALVALEYFANKDSNVTMTTQSDKSKLDSAAHHLDLIKSLEQKTDIWMNLTVICCLARYYTVAEDPVSAKSAVSKVVAILIAILSDGDETNDWFAYLQLGRVMEALEDEENAVEAWERLQHLGAQAAGPPGWFRCDECSNSIDPSQTMHVFIESFGLKYFHAECYNAIEYDVHGKASNAVLVAIISSKIDNFVSSLTLSSWKAHLRHRWVYGENDMDSIQPGSLPSSISQPVVASRSLRTKDRVTRPSVKDWRGKI